MPRIPITSGTVVVPTVDPITRPPHGYGALTPLAVDPFEATPPPTPLSPVQIAPVTVGVDLAAAPELTPSTPAATSTPAAPRAVTPNPAKKVAAKPNPPVAKPVVYRTCACGTATSLEPCPICGVVKCKEKCGGTVKDPANPPRNADGLIYSGCSNCSAEPALMETCAVCGKPVKAGSEHARCSGCDRPICKTCETARKKVPEALLKCTSCAQATHNAHAAYIAAHSDPIPPNTETEKYCASCGKLLTSADVGSKTNLPFTCIVCDTHVCRDCRIEFGAWEVSCRKCRDEDLM